MSKNRKKFKIGDRVKLIEEAENRWRKWVIGTDEVLTVKNVKKIPSYSKTILTVETDDGKWAVVNESNIYKVEEHESKKGFKYGDKVVLKEQINTVNDKKIIAAGETCTVKRVLLASNASSASVLKVEAEDGRWGMINENKVMKEEDVLKEGDLVKSISEDRESPDIVKGDLLVVRRTQHPLDKYILVSKESDMNFMFIFPKDKLEKILTPKREPLTGALFYRVIEDMTEEDEKMLKELEERGRLEYSFECERVDPREGMKNDFLDDKPRWDLLPLPEIEDLVKVYTAGAKKYAPNNWQKLDNGYQRYKAALFRHLLAYEKGERIDPDTKCMHLAQVVWNAVAMLWFDKNGKGLY